MEDWTTRALGVNGYPLVICYIAMVKPWPIEIEWNRWVFPFLKMVDLSMAVSHNLIAA